MYVRPLGGFEPLAERAEKVILQAQFALADYLIKEAPSAAALKKLARFALHLAKLDLVVRVGVLDTGNREEKADVGDLLAMLALAPFDQLPLEQDVYLNPTFGEASMDVGGRTRT